MDAKAIVEKIAQDADQAASQALDEAQKRVDALNTASDARVAQQKKDALRRAEKDGALLRERMLRMAELEDKKDALKAKRGVMEEAFSGALNLLENQDGAKKQAFFMNLLTQYAQGGETLLIGEKNADWFAPAFLNEANALLQKKGLQALSLGAEKVPGVGFALKMGGTQINCTMDALLSQSRMRLETDVARVLFG